MFGRLLGLPLRSLGVTTLLALAFTSVRAADPERAELAASRQRIQADHDQRVAQCRQQFVVTSCVEAAAAVRREGLAALQAREAEIDDRERKARAYARQSRIEAKQQRSKDTPTPVPLVPAASAAVQDASAEEAARASGRALRAPAGKASVPSPSRPARPKAVDPQEEAARFDARQAEARNRKAAAAERQKERERAGKAHRAPLPPVDAASQPRPAVSPPAR
jgi:hypothetical protein